MTKKAEAYRETLRQLADWEPFLLAESGLPGPRGNIELANVAADEGDESTFRRMLAYDPQRAPANSPQEFLAFCGVVGLGKLLAEGKTQVLKDIRKRASDPRWRVREAVAMALQRWGRRDMPALLREMKGWSKGGRLEQRAAVAALCEPDLLGRAVHVRRVLQILETVTASIAAAGDRKTDEFEALRKGLGYCWSVAVAAFPEEGKPRMERWIGSKDRDVQWVMKQNLGKNRLTRLDPKWVERAQKRLKV
ncbi:MAG TPA: hypothetical protein VIH26_07765 [Anaerolineales bacterium]